MASLLICSGSRVVLPGHEEPTPASIVIDKASGKIIQVIQGRTTPDDFASETAEWIDAGNNIVLPGLVECVHALCRLHGSY